jgi:hypothetical protein
VQSSTGYNPETNIGTLPVDAEHILYSKPSDAGKAFGKKKLKRWLDGVEWPYAKEEAEEEGEE